MTERRVSVGTTSAVGAKDSTNKNTQVTQTKFWWGIVLCKHEWKQSSFLCLGEPKTSQPKSLTTSPIKSIKFWLFAICYRFHILGFILCFTATKSVHLCSWVDCNFQLKKIMSDSLLILPFIYHIKKYFYWPLPMEPASSHNSLIASSREPPFILFTV